MKLDGTVTIAASREKVYNSLIDPNLVSQCAPGSSLWRFWNPVNASRSSSAWDLERWP